MHPGNAVGRESYTGSSTPGRSLCAPHDDRLRATSQPPWSGLHVTADPALVYAHSVAFGMCHTSLPPFPPSPPPLVSRSASMVFQQLHGLQVAEEEFIPFGGMGEDRWGRFGQAGC